jgi:hypothetical protein
MANIHQIQSASASRKSLGFTFLGMMDRKNDVPQEDYVTRQELSEAIADLKKELSELRARYESVWYRRFIKWIKTWP